MVEIERVKCRKNKAGRDECFSTGRSSIQLLICICFVDVVVRQLAGRRLLDNMEQL